MASENSKQKICILIGYFPLIRGGAEYQSYLLGRELIKEGKDVFYISIGHDKREVISEDGFRIYKLKSPWHNLYFLHAKKIKNILRRENPDFIYQRIKNSTAGIAANYCKASECKLIWHVPSRFALEKFTFKISKSIIFNFLESKILEYGIRTADYRVCQAFYQKKLLKKNFNKKCNYVIPNFHPVPQNLKFPKIGLPKVIWVANWNKNKQPEKFLTLAETLKKEKAVFIMIGRNPENSWANDLKKQISQIDNLHYLGEVSIDRVNDLLANGHVFVNTSKSEGFPNTFIQAWMRELPVVSLNVDPDGVIKKNRIGFHSKNLHGLVNDVKRLIRDKQLRGEIGKRAQRYAVQNHSLKNARIIVDLIEEQS